jgi:ACS family hexuronate transporter-like MFS transporter
MQALEKSPGSYRWTMVALLFAATTINYIDRNVIGFMLLSDDFRRAMLQLPADQVLTAAHIATFKEQMGLVDAAFKLAYGLGFVFVGWLIDRLGTRVGFAISIFFWSVAGMAVALVQSFGGLRIARFLLGLGEAGNFPSAIKSVAEWFPQQERALANGLFNSGANVGIILTAVAVPWLTLEFGWQSAFVVTGALGLGLLGLWWRVYYPPGQHPKLSAGERAYIAQGQAEEPPVRVSWWRLLGYRQTWAFVTGKVLSDPVWWFYLSWLPDFFNSNDALGQKLDLKTVGLPFIVIYLVSDLGNVVFGWLSSRLIGRGWPVSRARKLTLLACALCVLPVLFAATTHNLYVAVALVAVATAAHQGFSITNFTLISDMFPKSVVASVVGIGGFFGALVGTGFAAASGYLIVQFGYVPLFGFAATAYLLAVAIIHGLVPRLEKVEFGEG